MAFGQQSGPPATASQVRELLSLLNEAGYQDFRDARHPLELTQRQAGGRFTRDEAGALIEQLQAKEGTSLPTTMAATPRTDAQQKLLRVIPAEQLANELERRGWVVIAP